MLWKISLFAMALLSLSAPLGASVIYVSGDQTGTWSADTVIVTGEVRVPPGQSLIIQPGVEVLFSVYCKLIVDSAATLRAVGTAADSIRFDVLPPDTAWHGIRFLAASDSSLLEYCHLTHGLATGSGGDENGGAIYCSNSSPAISCSNISENSAGSGGGIYCGNSSSPSLSGNTISYNLGSVGSGIYCGYESNPAISDNTISHNSCGYMGGGGGIYCEYSNPTIGGNTISENSATFGGGIYCYNSSPGISENTISENSGSGIYCLENSNPSISGNIISQNSGDWGTGGISCDNSSPIINGNTILGNSAYWGTGGIGCCRSSPIITGNIICGNSAPGYGHGGGIGCRLDSHPTVSSNTVSGNSADSSELGGGLYCDGTSSLTLVNCIFWGNSPQQIYLESGGDLQATYCGIQDTLWPGQGNISVDPLFVDPENGDYHLQSTVGSYHGGSWLPDSLHSPCIDAGDPASPFANEPMPNGGRINMGFEGNTAEASLSTGTWAPPPIADLPSEFRLYSPHPNPFNARTVLSYQLPVASRVSLRVYDTAGRLLATLVDGWRVAGAHQMIFDGSGLPSGIYFAKLTAGNYSQVGKLILLK